MGLKLRRRIGEKLYINKDIVVTLLEIRRNQVQLQIDAPNDISIDREEIHLRKQKEIDDE